MDYYAATYHPSPGNYQTVSPWIAPSAPVPSQLPPASAPISPNVLHFHRNYIYDDDSSIDEIKLEEQHQEANSIEITNGGSYVYSYSEQEGASAAPVPVLESSTINRAAYYGTDNGYKKTESNDNNNNLANSTSSVAPPPTTSNPVTIRNWNAEFQQTLDLPKSTTDEQLIRFEKMTALSTDFLHAAKLYGKIIISEYNLPFNKKSIRPVEVGGTAGGEKYIHGGILFKFACDWKSVYNGDEHAMKAANHELKGLNRYFAVCHESGLRVPLFVLIDYLGFRLIAQSLVPINFRTLVYGSSDAGMSVFTADQKVNSLMQTAGVAMNLKGHFVGQPSDMKFLYAPIDIEVHKGTDGRYYLIDAARAFPPTAPVPGVKSCYLYKLLRPEFLKLHKTSLDPDAFSPFDVFNPERAKNREEITEATQYLLNGVIPQFCNTVKLSRDTTSAQLIDKLHQAGINVRYLGLVRKHAKTLGLRKLAVLEMFARTIKNIFRENLRLMSRSVTVEQTFVPYTEVAIALFGKVMETEFWLEEILPLANSSYSINPTAAPEQIVDDIYKQMESDPQYKVEKAIANGVCTFSVTGKTYVEQEWQQCFTCNLVEGKATPCKCRNAIPKFDRIKEILMYYLSFPVLFKRIEQLSGVRLSKACRQELQHNKDSFVFVSTDIAKFKITTKATNFALVAEANILHLKSLRISTGGERLFAISENKFEQAITSTPDDNESYLAYASALRQQALKDNFNIDWKKLLTAINNYHNGDSMESAVEMVQQLYQNPDAKYYIEFDQLNKLVWDFLLDKTCSDKTGQVCSKITSYTATTRRLVEPQLSSLVCRFKGLKNVTLHLSQRWPDNFVTLFQNNPLLEVLDLSHCEDLNDSHLEDISPHLKNLQVLNISFTAVKGPGIAAVLKNCPHLRSLQLSNLKLDDPIQTLKDLAECTRLENLGLIGRIELNHTNLEMLMQNRPVLNELCCTGTQLTDESFEFLAKKYSCTLQAIQLFRTYNVKSGLISLLQKCQLLKSVDLAICPNIMDDVLIHISGLPNLEKLSLMGNSEITDSTLQSICSACVKLTHLDLTQCTKLTREGLKAVKNLPKLKFLSLEGCDVVDEVITDYYSSSLSSTIILLNLSNTVITDHTLICLGQFRLVSLHVKRCLHISVDGIYQMLHDTKILQNVAFEETKLTPTEIFKLTSKYSRILETSYVIAAEEAKFTNHWIWNQLKLASVNFSK